MSQFVVLQHILFQPVEFAEILLGDVRFTVGANLQLIGTNIQLTLPKVAQSSATLILAISIRAFLFARRWECGQLLQNFTLPSLWASLQRSCFPSATTYEPDSHQSAQ